MHGTATLFLVRHGETDWNAAGRWQGQTDIPLNPRGREQAREVAGRLRGEGLGAIASSDLLRARTTAEIVAAELGLVVNHLDPGLRERRFGCFEGLTREEVAVRFPEAWTRYLADPGPAPPGGESRDALLGRLLPAVDGRSPPAPRTRCSWSCTAVRCARCWPSTSGRCRGRRRRTGHCTGSRTATCTG